MASLVNDDPIYLDYNATTPIDKEVASSIIPFITKHFGNPSSPYIYGRRTKEAIDHARQLVVNAIGASSPDEIFFTYGGTESANLAIKGAVSATADKYVLKREEGEGEDGGTLLPHVITCNIEHPCVANTIAHLVKSGSCRATVLEVDGKGRITAEQVREVIRRETCLVSIMHANNEVGTVQPIAEIVAVVREREKELGLSSGAVLVHTDCCQTLGKINVNVGKLGVDLLTIAGAYYY